MKNAMVPIPAPVWFNDIGILKEFIMEDGAQKREKSYKTLRFYHVGWLYINKCAEI